MGDATVKSKILIFSGAGLSADSGIPTFRDKSGLWAKYDTDEVCNEFTWKQNYAKVHEFYDLLRTKLADVEPNAMHHLLAKLQSEHNAELWTQNVDDLLDRTGATVNHVHGKLTEIICDNCFNVWDIGYTKVEHQCPECGHDKVKPNVIFFGQNAPKYFDLLDTFSNVFDDEYATIVVIGTSGQVVPFEWIIGNTQIKAFKVICDNNIRNLDSSGFDLIIGESAVNSVDRLELILADRINKTLTREFLEAKLLEIMSKL
jgi:NAD-dependent deacetylase